MILITGDIHGSIDIDKLDPEVNPELGELTKDDYVIIVGDFGLVWDNGENDLYWRNWLENMPYSVLFLDGNHENFDLLNELPEERWNGGRVHRLSDHILHLMRGQLFDIDGHTFFTFGGADSHDKDYRTEGQDWWPQELPNDEELAEARQTLTDCGFKVDYILTHCAPTSVQRELILVKNDDSYSRNRLTEFLEGVKERTRYKHWFCGHYHIDFTSTFDPKLDVMYNYFIELPVSKRAPNPDQQPIAPVSDESTPAETVSAAAAEDSAHETAPEPPAGKNEASRTDVARPKTADED